MAQEPCYLEPAGGHPPASTHRHHSELGNGQSLLLQRHNNMHYSLDRNLGATGSHSRGTRSARRALPQDSTPLAQDVQHLSPHKLDNSRRSSRRNQSVSFVERDYSELDVDAINDSIAVPLVDRAPVKDLLCLMNSHRALLKALRIPSYSEAGGQRSNLFNEMVRYVKYMWEKKSDLEAVINAGKIELEQTGPSL